MLVISGSKSKDQAGLGLYSLDSESLSLTMGSSAGEGWIPGWALGLRKFIWEIVMVWGKVGSFSISPSLPKVFPHLPTPQAVSHPFALTHPYAVTYSEGHNSCAYSCLLRLTSCPPILGTEDAKNSLGEKSHLVPRKDQKWGSDVGKQEMRVSEMSFRGGIQTGIRDGGIRDQAVTGKLHGYGSDGRDCSISRERLSIPLPMTPGPGSCHHVQ